MLSFLLRLSPKGCSVLCSFEPLRSRRAFTSPSLFLRNMPKSFPAPEFKIRKGLRQQLLQLIKNRGNLVVPSRRLEVSGDPDDNRFLECADAARADYLVTGNLRHFPRFWKKNKIITPREFIGLVAPHLIT